MIALVLALLCALLCVRLVVAGLVCTLRLVVTIAGVAIVLSYAIVRWVIDPIAAMAWWASRRMVAALVSSWVAPSRPSPARQLRHRAPHIPMGHLLARHRAMLAGVHAARL